MQPENLPDRLRQVLGPEAEGAPGMFDPTDAVQVDRVAGALLRRFREADDVAAFELLVDVTQPLLVRAAEEVAREVGLAMPADELVVTLFSRLYIDVSRGEPPRHFLAEATRRLREEAEAWCRDIALTDLRILKGSDGSGGGRGGRAAAKAAAGGGKANPGPGPDQAQIVSVCFHRLDARYRRLLRAKEVERLADAELADRFSLSLDDARAELTEARRRLNAAIQAARKGGG